jgi:CheY-like chemotaxis protein
MQLFKKNAMSENMDKSYEGKQILIAEDDVVNFTLMKTFLSKTGATIHWAKNGVEAVDISIKIPLDLVLMDIRMPEMNGIEATKLIKKFYPELPVVAQTAFAKIELENNVNHGIDEYISKPIDKKELLGILNKYL